MKTYLPIEDLGLLDYLDLEDDMDTPDVMELNRALGRTFILRKASDGTRRIIRVE